MTEDQLYELIERMIIKEDVHDSRDSISWNAHREAEKINDESVFQVLMKIVEDNRAKSKKEIRDSAYFIMGSTLKNIANKEAIVFLIDQLENETDKYVVGNILERLAQIEIPSDVNINSILYCSKSDKWQIRTSAIHALGSCSTYDSIQALAYYINQEDEKAFRYEIVYANASMGKIGTKNEILLLEKHIHSRIRDIRDSALYAIDSINSREKAQ